MSNPVVRTIFLTLFLLTGCGGPGTGPLTPENQAIQIKQDKVDLYSASKTGEELTLTLEQTLQRAVEANLDVRTSLVEEMVAAGRV